ncbi:MAG: DsbE family thiol:disulfide interchange protein [Rhodomicrobium sp.]|nr:DsbE family thiol:disulfide interchange protein [Rhodomicrobium sp.]
MTAGASSDETPGKAKPRATLILPLVLAGILLVFLFVALRSGDPSRLPSALIGKPVPEFSLPAIPQAVSGNGPVPGLSTAAFKTGRVSLLNVWASWCAPCAAESQVLLDLSKQGVPLFGVNYKDTAEAARRFLARYGNPFQAIGVDEKGLTSIDFGVYGVPETFVIDGQGRIAYRFPGPLTPEIVADKIMPAIKQAEKDIAVPRS